MGWLISLFTGSAGGYLVSAGVGAILAASAAIYGTHTMDNGALSGAQKATASLQSEYDGYKQSVATQAASDSAKTLQQKQADDARANDLQAKLLASQKVANDKSAKLNAILDKAAPQDVRAIGPVAGNYYSQLRTSPQAGHSANPGNP